jgi:5-methyltetrahydrofolate--homocysteine methyltransferase
MAFVPVLPLDAARIRSLPPLCLDGAWGTELQKLGARRGELAETWNVTAPDKVLSVARAYVDAGARIILSNTFSANRFVLEAHGAAGRSAELSKAGAAISKRAAEGRAYVFASLGPTGKMVAMGDVEPAEVEDAYAEQAAAVAEGGADAIVVETLTDADEAAAAIRGCLRGAKLPVGVTFTFDSGPDGAKTMMGVSVADAHAAAVEAGASFMGANCGRGIESYVGIARKLAEIGGNLPIWIKGNAGLPSVQPDGSLRYDASPETFEAAVGPLLAAGVRFIGGCCGTTPAHVRAIADAIARS